MSTFSEVDESCSVCGKQSSQTVIMSTNTFGSSDLDLRPPEMRRSTMSFWVQECPHCGYVAPKLSMGTNATEEWLKNTAYLSCDGRNFISSLAKEFYKLYLIDILDGKTKPAFNAVLNCAWACDDARDTLNAIYCREKALEVLTNYNLESEENETLLVMRADLLRRSGRFDEVIKDYKDRTFSQDILNKVIAFQVERAKQKDVACYTVADAVGK